MGMFDDIKFEMPCPMCGVTLRWFQSKDGGCGLQKLTPSELAAQADPGINYGVLFYTDCEACDTWTEVTFRQTRKTLRAEGGA